MKKVKAVIMPSTAIILALILAIGTSAFKKDKNFANVPMYYQLTTFDHNDVVDKSHWSTTTQNCSNGSIRACKVSVPSTYVSGGAFVSSITLEATPGNPSALSDVKSSGSSISPDIQNKP